MIPRVVLRPVRLLWAKQASVTGSVAVSFCLYSKERKSFIVKANYGDSFVCETQTCDCVYKFSMNELLF